MSVILSALMFPLLVPLLYVHIQMVFHSYSLVVVALPVRDSGMCFLHGISYLPDILVVFFSFLSDCWLFHFRVPRCGMRISIPPGRDRCWDHIDILIYQFIEI